MPDGYRPPSPSRTTLLTDAAVRSFGRHNDHPWVVAAVNWLHALRTGEVLDEIAIADHYALWCFDDAYYAAFNRLLGALGLRG